VQWKRTGVGIALWIDSQGALNTYMLNGVSSAHVAHGHMRLGTGSGGGVTLLATACG
jgi:hypothetical protein